MEADRIFKPKPEPPDKECCKMCTQRYYLCHKVCAEYKGHKLVGHTDIPKLELREPDGKHCVVCGKLLPPKKKKYCSPECMKAVFNIAYRRKHIEKMRKEGGQ
ncbi:DUF2116 family Zn-ribbon domain-containing protein [Phascolarctobacterium sp.]|uniref:DUF2116 family Zn-ribbon domain-containing protein n=1 Tax=Phascolarctobacterium sp. TaxID=2049039 RepID=UPI00386A9485